MPTRFVWIQSATDSICGQLRPRFRSPRRRFRHLTEKFALPLRVICPKQKRLPFLVLILVPLFFLQTGCGTRPEAIALVTESKPSKSPATRVRLLMVRHGQSCANIISEFGTMWSIAKHKDYHDPLLSDCGTRRTKAAATLLKNEKVDFVGSSPLLRAIETAFLQFEEKRVHVIPHVSEITNQVISMASKIGIINDLDNTAMARERQIELLQGSYPELKVDHKYYSANDESNWESFEAFLANQVLPSLLSSGLGSKKEYTIGIASHSNFLKDALGHKPNKYNPFKKLSIRQTLCYKALPGGHKPHNNQVLQLFYNYDVGSKNLTLDTQAGCHSLGAGGKHPVGVPPKPSRLCEQDFTRCVAQWPGRMFDTSLGPPVLKYARDGKTPEVPSRNFTYHERMGFPKVYSQEQIWADNWRNMKSMRMPYGHVGDTAYPKIPSVCDCRETV